MKSLELSLSTARRLAISKQHLAGRRPRPGKASIMTLLRDMRYLQLDPTNTVIPSQFLVLWSRLGRFRTSDLDDLAWRDKKVFEYWAHAASLVLTEDYPLFLPRMKQFASWGYQNSYSTWGKRMKWWLKENSALRKGIVKELRERGPLTTRDFDHLESLAKINPRQAYKAWGLRETAWGTPRSVPPMLDSMYHEGEIMVAGRQGRQKVWDLTERFLPTWAPTDELTPNQVEYIGAQHSLGALGVATPKQIAFHFLRWRYPDIKQAMQKLMADSKVVTARFPSGAGLKGEWYVRSDDVHLAERIDRGDWEPRTTLLSPFDNLISDRDRTNELFGFYYRIEIYTPKTKRRHGYFVLPILDGDKIVGRIDPVMDRRGERLIVNSVHAEPGAAEGGAQPKRIAEAVEDLAVFLGARGVTYRGRVPEQWRARLS